MVQFRIQQLDIRVNCAMFGADQGPLGPFESKPKFTTYNTGEYEKRKRENAKSKKSHGTSGRWLENVRMSLPSGISVRWNSLTMIILTNRYTSPERPARGDSLFALAKR